MPVGVCLIALCPTDRSNNVDRFFWRENSQQCVVQSFGHQRLDAGADHVHGQMRLELFRRLYYPGENFFGDLNIPCEGAGLLSDQRLVDGVTQVRRDLHRHIFCDELAKSCTHIHSKQTPTHKHTSKLISPRKCEKRPNANKPGP